MMEAMRSGLRGDLATLADLGELRDELKAEIHALERRMDERFDRMTKTFVTWMLASQAAFTTIVAVFFTVAT